MLSSILFATYIQDMPSPRGPVKVVVYAEDITVYATHQEFRVAAQQINSYLDWLALYLRAKHLFVSTSKQSAMHMEC